MRDRELPDLSSELPATHVLARYGLREHPFGPGVDVRFYCPLEAHDLVLGQCVRTVRQQTGIALVRGEPGTGKTMLARQLTHALVQRPSGRSFLPHLVEGATLGRSPKALLRGLAERLGAPRRTPNYRLYEAIERAAGHHLEARTTTVLLVDGAEHLEAEVLECLVLLWNLVTSDASRFLVRIVLFARPELLGTLGHAKHAALRSRMVFGVPALGPLAAGDLARLIAHRVEIAGGRDGLFQSAALERLHTVSGGIVGRALEVAAEALARGAAKGEGVISRESVEEAAGARANIEVA